MIIGNNSRDKRRLGGQTCGRHRHRFSMIYLAAVTRLRRWTMVASRIDWHFARSCPRARRMHCDTQCWKRDCDEEQQQKNDKWSRGTHSVLPYDATRDDFDA